MAICPACNQNMTFANSCTAHVEHREPYLSITNRCRDCGVQPGGTHHQYCAVERCAHVEAKR